jgi:hypothetical protein
VLTKKRKKTLHRTQCCRQLPPKTPTQTPNKGAVCGSTNVLGNQKKQALKKIVKNNNKRANQQSLSNYFIELKKSCVSKFESKILKLLN